MTVSTIPIELLIVCNPVEICFYLTYWTAHCFATVVWWYIPINDSVLSKDGIAVLKLKVEAKLNISFIVFQAYVSVPLISLQPNLVCCYTITNRPVANKVGTYVTRALWITVSRHTSGDKRSFIPLDAFIASIILVPESTFFHTLFWSWIELFSCSFHSFKIIFA